MLLVIDHPFTSSLTQSALNNYLLCIKDRANNLCVLKTIRETETYDISIFIQLEQNLIASKLSRLKI